MKLDKQYNFQYEFKGGEIRTYNNVVEFYNDNVMECHKLTRADGSVVFVAHNTWRTHAMFPTEPIKTTLDPNSIESWVSAANPPPPNGFYVALVKNEKSFQGLTTQMANFGSNGWYVHIQEDDGYWNITPVDVVAYLPTNLGLNAINDVREYFGNGDK